MWYVCVKREWCSVEREILCVCVRDRMCVCERENGVCVCGDRENVWCVWRGWECVLWERGEIMCVCARLCVCVRAPVCLCVCARAAVCVCVCASALCVLCLWRSGLRALLRSPVSFWVETPLLMDFIVTLAAVRHWINPQRRKVKEPQPEEAWSCRDVISPRLAPPITNRPGATAVIHNQTVLPEINTFRK